MYRKLLNLISYHGILVFELILLSILLFWRYKLGITRYFDIDEFAHLHWAYSLFIGERPYTDFFYHFPPFFLYPIAAIFFLFGRSVASLTFARITIFMVFLATTVVFFLIVKKLRHFHIALLSTVVFAFLPLPFDRMIEIRPDLLALFFALLGLYLFILWIESGDKKYLFWTGFCYGLSLGFIPKTVFFLIPSVVVLGYQLFSKRSTDFTPRGSPRLTRSPPGSLRHISFFFLGTLPALFLLFGLIISYGNPLLALYSMTKLVASIHKTWGSNFFIPANFFFYPNDVYYGVPGFSLPYFTNLIIYLSASFFAIFRFISSLSYKEEKKCQKEFLVGAIFWLNLYAFVHFYPMKHAQHLIFIAPFIAFYFADLLGSMAECKLLKYFRLDAVVVLATLFLIGFTDKEMIAKKLLWMNKPVLDKLNNLLSVIPKEAAVFDLAGTTIFFRDGYYFCCLPYGQFSDVLWIKIPSLENDMKKRNTKYVYVERQEGLGGLPPPDAKYIKDNFVPYSDGSLLIKK